MANKKFYITTPIYYVNSSPHIGHAYTNIIADAVARFYRQLGIDTLFLTGTDEHGQKVEKAAQQAGKPTLEFVDELAQRFRKLWGRLNISYDDFIRTTEARHKTAVQYVLALLKEKGDIYLGKYHGFYCVPCETFWAENQIVKDATGEGVCPDCQRRVEPLVEDAYFFRMSKYQAWLIDYLGAHPDFIKPESRFNEVKSFLEKERLEDLCISRPKTRFEWGIDIPFDNAHITYVWFDALINYISAIGYPDASSEKFAKYWPADIHLIGKDILRQHAVYWPIMLKALGLPIPKQIVAHGWWLVEEKGSAAKMSKSRGNIVDPFVVTEEFGLDVIRYFLLREIPLGVDGIFSYESIVKRCNGDLANDLGNLVYRTLSMGEKYIPDGIVRFEECPKSELVDGLLSLGEDIRIAYASLDFAEGLGRIWDVITMANKFIEEQKPWVMRKEGRIEALQQFMYILLEALRVVAYCIYPVMPDTAASIWEQIGLSKDPADVIWDDVFRWGVLENGVMVSKGEPLFPRREE